MPCLFTGSAHLHHCPFSVVLQEAFSADLINTRSKDQRSKQEQWSSYRKSEAHCPKATLVSWAVFRKSVYPEEARSPLAQHPGSLQRGRTVTWLLNNREGIGVVVVVFERQTDGGMVSESPSLLLIPFFLIVWPDRRLIDNENPPPTYLNIVSPLCFNQRNMQKSANMSITAMGSH